MNLQQFNFQDHQVRIVIADNGEPQWVARDVAVALGYKNESDAIKRHCRGVVNHYPIQDRLGRTQKVRVIAEPDLYRLIVGSDLDTAQEFEKLVFEEILPSVRKHGGYLTPDAVEKMLADPSTAIKLLEQIQSERDQRKALEEKAALDAPKVLFADAVSASTSTILVGELAKILRGNGIDVGGTRLFAWLRAHGFLVGRKGSDWNCPTQKSMELGIMRIKETTVLHSDGHTSVSKTPKVTGKGQEYFVSRFLDGRFNIYQKGAA